jgi:methionyl-tRNA formyltransferase
MALRTIFMGTPDFAVPSLRAIAQADHPVIAVYTQPPRPAGRGMAERPSPVALEAGRLGIPVFTPTSLKPAAVQAEFAAHSADVAVVAAYGLILPQPILDAPRHGALNLHPSLLPRWRGAAPIQRPIMAGDAETGIAVMRMEAGLDTGPVALERRLAVPSDWTAGDLQDRLAEMGAALMVEALGKLEADKLAFTPQAQEGVTYASKIDKAEARIDWSKPARAVHDHIRGLSPFPGAWFEMETGNGRARVKVLRSTLVAEAGGHGAPGTVLDDNLAIACGEGAVRLLELQREGKRALPAEDFLRGAALGQGARLG